MTWLTRIFVVLSTDYGRQIRVSLQFIAFELVELVLLILFLAFAFVATIVGLWARHGDNPQHGHIPVWWTQHPHSDLYTPAFDQAVALTALSIPGAGVPGGLLVRQRPEHR